MDSLPDLRRRIRSVQSTRKVIRAMEMISGARLRRAQQYAAATRPYTEELRRIICRIASSGACSDPVLEPRETRHRALVVMSSDKGLCGGFNSSVTDKALEVAGLEPGDDRVITIGKRCRDRFPQADPEVSGEMGGRPDQRKAAKLTIKVMGMFRAGEVDQVDIVYNSYRGGRPSDPVVETILPVIRPESVPGCGEEGETIFDPSAEEVLADAFPRYVTSMILSAMAESLASEHSARLASMAAAGSNADEMIERLKLQRNKLRQSSITREITELVGGAGAPQ
ncbi:MAG: ATP synthase F1 subunit gamma [Candidatus Fermentibacter sp.]|nr:ATP synthase F1 subunit gamma [Candidatus Fermentibacter sp.]